VPTFWSVLQSTSSFLFENFRIKVGFWPKKVGFCPLLFLKVGREKFGKCLENGTKSAKKGLKRAILGHFRPKIGTISICEKRSAHFPTFFVN
jgi:hypothetical protein